MPVLADKTDTTEGASVFSDGGAGFGVYIHWPFCAAKCPYCDFNSHVRHDPVDQRRYLAAYLRELEWFADHTPGRRVDSIFFGGGTPSLMHPDIVAALIAAVGARWRLGRDVEITLEANPTSVEAGRFAAYGEAGVNRVSMGLQALSDDALKRLGRLHSVAEARAAFDIARARFRRVSFDLIYARPGQSLADWRAELAEALDFAADHLSLYQLTIEEGTPFFDLRRAGRLVEVDDDHARALYDATQDLCATAGLAAYEVSNHAVAGAECRHNLVYWRSGDYAGIGPGAHGRISHAGRRLATATELAPERWREMVEARGNGLTAADEVDAATQAEELLLMGLRLAEGVEIARYEALAGRPLHGDKARMLEEEGLLETTSGGRLRATREGRLLLNSVIAALAV